MFYQLFIISAITLFANCQYPSSQQYGSPQPRYSSSLPSSYGGSSSGLSLPSSYGSSSLSSSSLGSSSLASYRPSTSQLGASPQYSSGSLSSSPPQYSSGSLSSSPPQYSSGSLSSSSPQYTPPQYSPSQYLTTPPPKQISPPAQVHYVNIGADLAGDYKFGYDTGKGPLGQSFREESRLPDGTVRGAYGYVDANGQQRVVKYSAGKEGFKVENDSPAGPSAAPAAAVPRAQPQPTYSQPAPITYSQPAPVQAYRPQPAPQYSPSLPQAQPIGTYTPSLPQSAPQTYRAPSTLSSPSLRAYTGAPRQPEEETTYGPPVINTALLNYNIGTQQG